jgi:hypothetical protein
MTPKKTPTLTRRSREQRLAALMNLAKLSGRKIKVA